MRSFDYIKLIIVAVVSYVAVVTSDQFIHCTSDNSSDVCLNNGTCLLTSRTAAYQFCREDESYYDGKCYRVVKQLKTWNEANDLCQQDGVLTAVTSELQQLFVSDLLLDLTTDIPEQNVAFWIGGHALPNGSEAVYVWAPNNYVIESDFWEDEQPPPLATANCIEINSWSFFRNWTAVNCATENYFICSRSLAQGNDELENEQCMCYDGYRGNFCNISFNEPGVAFQSQSVACVNDVFEFSCPNGGTISVDFAAYGNTGKSYELCLTSPVLSTNITDWEICTHPSSLQTLISMCQGLTYCRIENLQSLFPDRPCLSTTPINLQYRMRCLNEPLINCRPNAIYQNGRCYVPYALQEPLSLFDAQTECRKEGGQLAFSVGQTAQNEIVARIRKEVTNGEGSCYWMAELGSPQNGSRCECFYVTSKSAAWSTRNCSSLQQWVCEFAPEGSNLRPTEMYHKPTEQHIIFDGHSDTESSTTDVTTKDEDLLPTMPVESSFCETYHWDGITFPKTKACSNARVPCPNPDETIGVVTQKCNCETSKWDGRISFNNCTHKWVGLLDKLIDENKPAEDISRQWAESLQNTSEHTLYRLYGGDILGSIEIGERLLSLARIQYALMNDRAERSKKATEFTQMYGEAGDELLSSNAAPVWLTLPDDVRVPKASTLMTALEQSAILMADFITEQQKKIDYSNWALEVQVKKPVSVPVSFRSLGSSPVMVSDDAPVEPFLGNQEFVYPSTALTTTATAKTTTATTSVSHEDVGMENISFSSFSLSPVISMPSLNVLQQSAQTPVLPRPVFADFGGLNSTVQPRSGFVSLNRNPLRLGYYVFKSVGTLLNTNETSLINSLVIGASVNDPRRSIKLPKNNPVTFKFYHIRRDGVSNPRCVFWDTANHTWSEEGCTMLSTSNESTECSCTHLTSFAILMDISGSYNYDEKTIANEVLNLITIVGCAFSIACLFIAFLVFSCFRSLWSTRHTIHRNLCLCLLLAELVFVIGVDRTRNIAICRSVAVALHYLFLAAFCWMLLEGYQLYLMLIQVFDTDEAKIVVYYLYAYGFPAVIVAVTAGVAWPNYGTKQYCWLNVETPTIWAFAGPIAVVIVSNIVFLGVALQVVLSVRSRERTRVEQMFGWLKGSATLLCLLGVTWIFGYLMVIQGAHTVFAYIFTVLNCLQGVFIFIIHVILNDKVRLTLIRFLRVNVCCMPDAAPGHTPSVISSRQKLINTMKNGDLSRRSSRPSTDSSSAKSKNKGMFVEKTPPRLKVAESPATMITYLEWKSKLSNESGSIPSDDSGNYDCEPKESRSASGEVQVNLNVSRKESSTGGDEQAQPVRRKIYSNIGSEQNPEPNRTSSDESTIIERF